MSAAPVSVLNLSDTADHRCSVNALLQAATDYHLLVEGAPPTSAHVDAFFTSVPDGYSTEKLFPLGFYVHKELVGAGGVLRGWNAPNKAHIGLMVFDPRWRGFGYGRAAVKHIEALAHTWPGIDKLRIAVVRTNSDALVSGARWGLPRPGRSSQNTVPSSTTS